MSVVAISMRTESGDDYLSLFTGVISPEDFVGRVEENMGNELAYVYYKAICTDNGSEAELGRALQVRIEELQEEEGFYD